MLPDEDFTKTVRIVSDTLDGSWGKEVTTFDEVYPLIGEGSKPLSLEQLEIKLAILLGQAKASGFNVTVSNENNPRLGMGGSRPLVNIRPAHSVMRAKMADMYDMHVHFQKHGCHGFTVAEETTGGDDASGT